MTEGEIWHISMLVIQIVVVFIAAFHRNKINTTPWKKFPPPPKN
jgi:hypothetical protein